MKGILNTCIWAAVLLGTLVLLGFSNHRQSGMTCRNIIINIDRSENNFFVNEEDIFAMVYHEMDTAQRRPISEINTERIERQLNSHPSISNVEVYKSIDGELMIDVKQRKPIIRVFNMSGDSYYLDENGKLMPPSEQFTARVMVANGYLFESYEKVYQHNAREIAENDSLAARSRLDDIFLFAEYINKHPFWQAQIEQLYVNKEFEIELIPRVGNHTIVFGDASGLDEKFNKLMIFYNQGLNKTGWNEYSTINLKFKDQIICTKI